MVIWILPDCPRQGLPRFWGIFFFILATAQLIGWTSSQPPIHHYTTHTISTKYGSLRGVKLQFSSSSTRHLDPVTSYLGIPYASPPINAYRFMPPVAPLPWGGTRLAVSLPPACPQKYPDVSNRTKALQSMTLQRYLFLQKLIPHLANQSEDCLYLNIYVPTVPPGDEIRPGKFAIVLVIHGESWEWGSGNEFDGGVLASLGNHIVVTFNYRLGILGFLKTSNQQSNFGLLDVIAAVHWVRENGDSFGGDRNRITLFGYRTGAVVANLLLVAQIAKGLFQRAILISGSVLSPWALQRRPEDVALQVSKHLNCLGVLPLSHPESDLAPCLRRKHLSDLLNFVPDTPRFLSPFAPYVDNILFRQPKGAMEGEAANEQFLRSQLLIIFATSESVHELNDYELKDGFEAEHRDRVLRTLVRNVFTFHQQEIFSIVRNEYTDWERPMLHPIPLRDATVEALSDCLVIGPALQVALIHSRRKGKTFVMHFSHVSKDVEFLDTTRNGVSRNPRNERLGSLEGDIVPYSMGLPVTNNVPALGGQQFLSPWSTLANFTKQDAFVSETLVHYLANFAKSGDPNINEAQGVPRLSPSSNSYGLLGLSSLGGSSSVSGNSLGVANEWNSGSSGSSSSLSSNSNSNSGATSSHEQRSRLRSPHWDAFEPGNQSYMNIGTKPKTRTHYRGHKMALWLNLIPQIHLPGGTDVTLSHHTFQDDNPNLYIGPVRPLVPYRVGDAIPGFGSAGVVVTNTGAGQGGSLQEHGLSQSHTTSPGMSLTTTECLESTETSFTQGTRHSVVIDSNEVEVEIRGGGTRSAGGRNDPSIQLSSSPNAGGIGGGMGTGEYDYTTALTVTLTVGVCLILLNLLVFSAIMCHRKRGLGIPVNLTDSPGGGRRNSHSHGGTPLKTPYQEDYKWSSCCSSSMNPENFPSHLSYGEESIAMNQYPAAAIAHLDLKPCPGQNPATSSGGGGGIYNCNSSSVMRSPRSPSPLMGVSPINYNKEHYQNPCHQPQHYHQHQQQNYPQCHSSSYQSQSQGGTLKRVQVQMPMCMSVPDCVHGAMPNSSPSSPNPDSGCGASGGGCGGSASAATPGSMRLYMNHGAGEEELPDMPDLPRSTRNSPGANNPNPVASANPVTSTNPSPSTSTPGSTLVGVLKRHSSSTTPNSTIKKRVQIQEISV